MQILSSLGVKVDTREKQILRALLDKHCLAILNITRENTMTASMIYSCCNISPSTAYRKLKLLQELKLLHASYTIRGDGKKILSFQNKINRINILLHNNQLLVHINYAT